MTDARIITREVLLELANDIYRKAFEAGYEAGALVACLETPAPDDKAPALKRLGLKLNPSKTSGITVIPESERPAGDPMKDFDSFVINGVRVPNPNKIGG